MTIPFQSGRVRVLSHQMKSLPNERPCAGPDRVPDLSDGTTAWFARPGWPGRVWGTSWRGGGLKRTGVLVLLGGLSDAFGG